MTEFTPTHVRRLKEGRRDRSRVEAQALARIGEDTLLYKVRFKERGRDVVRFTTASVAHFARSYERIA